MENDAAVKSGGVFRWQLQFDEVVPLLKFVVPTIYPQRALDGK
jgi:hypothetical protein